MSKRISAYGTKENGDVGGIFKDSHLEYLKYVQFVAMLTTAAFVVLITITFSTTVLFDDIVLEGSELTWTLYNINYSPLTYFTEDTDLTYAILNSYDSIIEPDATMGVYMSKSKYTRFNISLCLDSECVDFENEFAIKCDPHDSFDVSINASNDDYSEWTYVEGSALCIYVRREIRSLTDADLNKTMNAMYAMWEYSASEGEALYGPHFHSHTYFTSAHYFASAGLDSDYSHGGLGFFPQHSKLSNVFEKSMQAVDYSVSLPYWDYTIDAQYDSIKDAYIFQESVFGTLTMPSDPNGYWLYSNNSIEDGRIRDGRWKHLKIESNSDYISDSVSITSPYGYMRAPWSANPSPYLLRFPVGNWDTDIGYLPGCFNYYSWIQSDTLYTLLNTGDISPHTKAHWAIGSMFGCDLIRSVTMVEYDWMVTDYTDKLCVQWGIFIKAYFRLGAMVTDTNCTASVELEDVSCAWKCVESMNTTLISSLKLSFKKYFRASMTESDWEDFYDWMCNGSAYKIFFGDHREPASPSDPSFWPIHPTLERAYHAKAVTGFSSLDWTDSNTSSVCGSDECYENGVDGYYSNCCYGHYETDGFPDFISGNKNTTLWQTNRELLTASDASSGNYSMHYIYDSFSWNHCNDTSYDIDSLLATLIS